MKHVIRTRAALFVVLFIQALSYSTEYAVSIRDADIYLNDQPIKILGLRLSNAMVSDEKVRELIDNLDVFKSYGVNTVSVFFMGSRFGDIKGFNPDASLNPVYTERMGRIIEAADARGMIILVGCLYWGTSTAKGDLGGWGQSDANTAVANTVRWLSDNDYRNVIVDADNEGMSPWNVGQMCTAGHAQDNTIMVGNNEGRSNPECDLNIHFGPQENGKPWFDSEATPDPGTYWADYSKEAYINNNSYYNYSRIGRYTSSMKDNQFSQTRDGMRNRNGHILASTWLQCAPNQGVGGPFMTPGGMSEISDVNANIDDVHPDAGVLWWLEFIQSEYGAWVPPELTAVSQGQADLSPRFGRLPSDGTGENLFDMRGRLMEWMKGKTSSPNIYFARDPEAQEHD